MQDKSLRELAYQFLDDEMDAETQRVFEARIECCIKTQSTTSYCRELLTIVRQRCPRHPAPPRLRRRIIAIIKHDPDTNH